MIYVTGKQLAGTVAMWAVRQSPYQTPDNLDLVVRQIQEKFAPNTSFGMLMFEESNSLRRYVSKILRSIPEYVKWNDRKNGNDAPLKFSSAYDLPGDPDDDFIDLDALEGNVARSISSED
ncbi:hypothetical protein [Rhizobium mesoamericanum]|uniref:Uncharacterized protein n=1 Tax=Rhizobium mesoamericanum STM3625 TaxID=1211777 RepID=K0PZX6_9HYPH|nr:hypothetical protein [Rhizobium mesoamericanum]CCM77112.1 hypothetical protein BN77_4160 [Rhizobium mesoamericanum STM3625]